MTSTIIGKIDIASYNIESEIKHLNGIEKIPEAYDEFGQGHWKNISLYNASGDCGDSTYRNTSECRPTSHLTTCVEINRLIVENFKFDDLKMVRARSLVDGMVIPHRDFVEFDGQHQYLRLFVPLEDNSEAFHSDETGVFQMKSGEVWFLDAAVNHAAINVGLKSRMFLCLDFLLGPEDEQRSVLLQSSKLLPLEQRIDITRATIAESRIEGIIDAVAVIISRHTMKDIIFALSKYHFKYDIPVLACYDWIRDAALRAGDQEVAARMQALKHYLVEHRSINERFRINDWRN